MIEAHLRFDGAAFHLEQWSQLLRRMGFAIRGGAGAKASYVAGGNIVVAEDRGFVTRDDRQGYEWHVTLRQTRRWEGAVVFYAVLLAAFALPQPAVVTLAGDVVTDRTALQTHAEAALVREFTLDELVAHGVYRPGDGIRFI
jgi:hypothetical protein